MLAINKVTVPRIFTDYHVGIVVQQPLGNQMNWKKILNDYLIQIFYASLSILHLNIHLAYSVRAHKTQDTERQRLNIASV